MKTALVLSVLLLLGSFCSLEAANILCLVSSAKHNNPGWSRPLFDALVAKGHHLTVLSSAEPKQTPKEGLLYFHLPNEYDVMKKHFLDEKTGEYKPMIALKQLLVWYEVVLGSCSSVMGSTSLSRLLPEIHMHTSGHFDLLITDVTEGANCLLDLVFVTMPVLGLSGGKLTPDLISLLKAEDTISAASTPHHLSQVPKKMGFWNRLHNHIMYLGEPIINWLIIRPVLGKMVNSGKVYPKLQVVLLNTHPVVDYIQNLPPGVIEVGGLHIKDKPKALPIYIERFTDKFIYGIVLIDMPYIESIGLGVKAVYEMIENNPQVGFIWNVMAMGSMPSDIPNLLTLYVDQSLQQDILALAPVKGFLNHGDSFSIQEAVNYGVPTVVLPLSLEQFNTAQRVKERSFGVVVSAKDIHLKSFVGALHSILNGNNFTSTLYHAQQKYRSRLQSPLELAVWHAEQIIADPSFFSDLAQERQNFFVAHSLDVLAVPAFLFIIFVLNVFYVFYNLVKGKKKTEPKECKEIKEVVEEKEPLNKSLLEQSTNIVEDLNEEMIEGEMELLSEQQSQISEGAEENDLPAFTANHKINKNLQSIHKEKTLQDKKMD